MAARTVRCAMLTLVGVSLTLPACGSDTGRPSAGGSTIRNSLPPGSATHSPTPLEGRWRTKKVKLEDVIGGITREEARIVFRVNDISDHFVSILDLNGTTWRNLVEVDAGRATLAQAGDFRVRGDVITMTDHHLAKVLRKGRRTEFRPVYRYRFKLGDGDLRLRLLSTNAPPSDAGVKDEVFQFVFYEATAFRRTE